MALPARLLPLLAGLLLAGSLLASDLATKSWAESELRRRGARSLLGGRLVLRYQTNSGIAFGLFQKSLHPYKRPFLIAYSTVVSAGLLAALVVRSLRRTGGGWVMPAGLAALLAGAVGNLRDRITRGAVIDFIDVRVWGDARWPAFNLADVYLSAGLILCGVALVGAGGGEADRGEPGTGTHTGTGTGTVEERGGRAG
jgi:signal peptidase II